MNRPAVRAAGLLYAGVATFIAFALHVAGSPAQQLPDRSKPPALGPAPQLHIPAIHKRALSNGLEVWIVEADEVPLVQANLLVKAGAGDDPAGFFGLASLTAAMLDEGAGGRTALEIADAIEFLGAQLSTNSSFDASAVRLNVPITRLPDALAIMADVVVRPTFPEAELNRLRQERITALLQARDDPASVATMAFSRVVFGNNHRYGVGATGMETTLKSFAPQQLKTFHAAMYRPSNAALIVVGAVKADAVMPELERHFGAWHGNGNAAPAPVPQAPQLTRTEITIVDMPAAEQSQIRIGWVGVPRSTPDYFILQVLNTILGGSFSSRLNQNLREEHGYAYGASSRFDMRRSAGPFLAAAGVQTDKTAEAVREFFNEFAAIQKVVAVDELARARNYVALSLPAEFETLSDLSARLEEMIVYGLADDYYEKYIANIQNVSAESVQRAAATYIQPGRFAVVVVGDRKLIEPGIRRLNIATVRVVSVDEILP